MKNRAKKLLSVLLAALMCSASMAVIAAADEIEEKIVVGDIVLTDGTWTADGVTKESGKRPNSGYAYYKDGTLTLNNFQLEGNGYAYESESNYAYYTALIYCYGEKELKIVLEGENTLDASEDGIVAEGTDLTVTGKGSLKINAGTRAIRLEGTGYDEELAEYANAYSLTVDGVTLELNAGEYGDAIRVYEHLTILNSYITAYSEGEDAIEVSGKISIENSTLDLESTEDDALEGGEIFIENSRLNLISEDENGMEADGDMGSGDITIINSDITVDTTKAEDEEDDGIDATGKLKIHNSGLEIMTAGWAVRADEGIEIDKCPAGISIGKIMIEEKVYDESIQDDYVMLPVPYYTFVDEFGNPVKQFRIEEPSSSCDFPNLSLTGIRLIENGEYKDYPAALGSRRTFKFGENVLDVTVNGKSVGAVEKYTVVVIGPMTIKVTYAD